MPGKRGAKGKNGTPSRNITVIGAGYVGVVTGACLAELGNRVVCLDIDAERIDLLNSGKAPFYEKGLNKLLQRNIRKGRLISTLTLDQDIHTDVFFICVGTPSSVDGHLEIRSVKEASIEIAKALRYAEGYPIVAVKSTVPPGTLEKELRPLLEKKSKKIAAKDFGLASNPEFLREGNAIRDFMHPDRIVIGTKDDKAFTILSSIYQDIDAPILRTSPDAAEMIKMASNAFLAAKVSLINEIGNLCKGMGIDVREVAEGVGMDRRIGKDFLRAGCGFGGSCFPKDVRALSSLAQSHGVEARMLNAILAVNQDQPLRLIELLCKKMDIKGRTIGVLGLAFKPGTDDVREAPSLRVVEELMSRGAKVCVHDYRAMKNFRKLFPQAMFCRSPKECIQRSDAIIILTEWPGYSDPSLYGDKLVIDGRGVTRSSNYEGVCW